MQSFDDVVLIQVTLHINYILLTQISRCGGGCGGGGGGGWGWPGTGGEGGTDWATDAVLTLLGDLAGLEKVALVLVVGEVPAVVVRTTPGEKLEL